MIHEIIQRPAEGSQDVEIRSIGCEYEHQTGPGIPAVQAGLAHHHAGQRVGEVVHAVLSTLAGLRDRNPGGTSKVNASGTISTVPGARPTYSPSTCRWI